MKAIILARVSSKDQEDGQSIPAQVRRLTEYAEKKNLESFRIFQITESSTKDTRKQFDQIINLIKKMSESVALITDTVDRLQRSFRETPMLDELRKQGLLELHFLRENLIINKDSNSSQLLQWDIGVLFASSYVRQLSDNVKRSKEQCTRNGQWTSKAPCGYKNVRLSGGKASIELHETNAQFVIKIFMLYAAGNKSYESIADEMNKLGMRTDKGEKIHPSKIGTILKNPFYYGYMKVKGELHKHDHPILISEYLFNQLQETIMEHKKAPVKYARRQFIFSGLIKCKNCGCTVCGEIKKKKYIYYSCNNAKRTCKKVFVREEELLAPLIKNFEDMQLSDSMIEEVVEHLKKTFVNEQAFTKLSHNELQCELNNLQSRISKLIDMHLDNKIDNDAYHVKLGEYKKRQREISSEMQAHVDADESCLITAKMVLDLAKRAKDLFLSSSVEEKQQLLKLVHSNFLLDSGKLHWEMSEPFSTFIKMKDRTEWCA